MNVLELCNVCESRKAIPGEPGGLCKACLKEAKAQAWPEQVTAGEAGKGTTAEEPEELSPEFLAFWNSPEIMRARRDMCRRNGLREWFNASLEGAK